MKPFRTQVPVKAHNFFLIAPSREQARKILLVVTGIYFGEGTLFPTPNDFMWRLGVITRDLN